jgi:peptidoglycan/xylan/chitin deacetylase (PgdA/CDA1 family)
LGCLKPSIAARRLQACHRQFPADDRHPMIGALKARTPQPAKTAIRRATRWLPRRPRPAILMYHRIAQASFDPWGLAVEEQHLAAQFEWLARHRCVISLVEFAKRHREGTLATDAVAITFDDGYWSAVRAAVPLLERFGLHATIFLPTEPIEQGREFWWDELARIVLDFDGETLRLLDSEVRVPPASPRDRIWLPDAPPDTPRQVLFYSLWARLRPLPPAAIDETMRQIRRTSSAEAMPADRPVHAEELRSTKSAALAFGSHALTHPSLPSLPLHEQEREIVESRDRCASLAGKTPASFAYPYGDFDECTRRLVEDAGFQCACSARHAFVTPRDDVFALPRLRVGNRGSKGLRDMLRNG